MDRTLEVALAIERKTYPDFAEYEQDMTQISTLIPGGSIEQMQQHIHGLYLLAKSGKTIAAPAG